MPHFLVKYGRRQCPIQNQALCKALQADIRMKRKERLMQNESKNLHSRGPFVIAMQDVTLAAIKVVSHWTVLISQAVPVILYIDISEKADL